MALELIYTSAVRGLRAGTSGFCTVAMTKGLPPALVPRLEALGGYRPGPSGNGPNAYCFWRVETATGIAHVLSIVGPAPPDHTARSNKIATYLVLAPDELVPAGPAWLLSQPALLRNSWSGAPAWIDAPVRVPTTRDVGPRPCVAWQTATGDAGWAGVLASAFLRDQARPIHVIYGAAIEPLPLVEEAIRLLPEWARWRATFSTYFLQPVAGTPCAWRFCLDGTPAADAARQSKGLVIDLTRTAGPAPESRFTRMARTGVDEEAVAVQKASRTAAAAAIAGANTARPSAAPIELEEDFTGDPAGAPRRLVRDLDVDDQDASSGEPARMSISPPMLAMAAAGLTVVLLVLIYIVSTTTGQTGAPAVPAVPVVPAPPAAAAVVDTSDRMMPPLELTATPNDVDAKEGTTPTAPQTVAPTLDTQGADSVPMRNSQPPKDATEEASGKPTDPVTPVAPVPTTPVITPLVLPTIAKWSPTSAFERVAPGAVQLRLRVDIGAKTGWNVNFVPAKSLAVAGVTVKSKGGIEFGGSAMSAKASIDGADLVITGSAAGLVPDALQLVLRDAKDGKDAKLDPVVALQRALERCTVEVFDKSGASLGFAQMRTKSTKPLNIGTENSTSLADFGDSPLDVQVTSPAVPEATTVRVGPSQVEVMNIADSLTISVSRAVQKSATVFSATTPSSSVVGLQVTALSKQQAELSALKKSCNVVLAVAKGGIQSGDFGTDLQTVQNALLPEEQKKFLGDGATSSLTSDRSIMRAMVESITPRIDSELNLVSKKLTEANAASKAKGNPGQWRMRVSNEDGIVLLESAITPRVSK
ncbi:MAG: hypothetical protein DWH92_01415 [Planctomycetota bacterium]|nr:MAG: hypothetical protein DWH92_01415 [Planctomycetota bacterium]